MKFTASDIINYIVAECLCTNEKAFAISKMVRYNNQTLLDWLQSFVAPVNKFLKAIGQDNLGADDAKTIWKDHFVNQITLSETSLMMLYKREHLVRNELTSIKDLAKGE